MKKLLVPVDTSGAAQRALGQAISLARLSKGSIHLVHAHEEPIVYGELAVYAPRKKMEQWQRAHSEAILRRAAVALRRARVRYTQEVLVGPVARSIVRCAQRRNCDAIVMGRHGESALGNLLLGSIAMKVLHASRLPVMLVR